MNADAAVKKFEDAWARMDALNVSASRNDPGITIEEYAERYSLTRDIARHRLDRFVRQRKMILGYKSNGNGHKMRVYRFPEE